MSVYTAYRMSPLQPTEGQVLLGVGVDTPPPYRVTFADVAVRSL